LSYVISHYKEDEESLQKSLTVISENNSEAKNENKTSNQNENKSLSEGKSTFQIISNIKPPLVQRSCLKQMFIHSLPKVNHYSFLISSFSLIHSLVYRQNLLRNFCLFNFFSNLLHSLSFNASHYFFIFSLFLIILLHY
jgi:hypothetical protein